MPPAAARLTPYERLCRAGDQQLEKHDDIQATIRSKEGAATGVRRPTQHRSRSRYLVIDGAEAIYQLIGTPAEKILLDRLFSNLPINLCIVMALSAVGSARADEALPSQDQALARALENHPDIVTAKAKVALADAVFYGKRMEVSRQVLGFYGSLKRLDAQIDASKAALIRSKAEFERLKQVVESGKPEQSTKDELAAEVQAMEAQLVQTIGQREQAEKELRLLIGTASPAAEIRPPNKAATATRQAPQGPIVEQMKIAQEKLVKLDFVDMPLQRVMKYLSDETGMTFSVQEFVLEECGIGSDFPISLHTKDVPLLAALQGFEDAFSGMQFVLRDYGVLLTTKDYAQEHGYAPVLEQANGSAATFKSR